MAVNAGKKAPTVKKSTASEKKYLCPYCNKEKKESDFYMSTDPLVLTGRTSMCKDCAKKIARNWDDNKKEYGNCTKSSVQAALERLDKPWIESLWDSSYHEVYDETKKSGRKESVWEAYIKNIGMTQYKTMRWRDGDLFNTYVEDAKVVAGMEQTQEKSAQMFAENQEVNSEFKKNKQDVVRLLGYDPFESEKLEDQPLLYSQLIGYLDTGGDGNDDMMRTSSAITIVRGFLQQAKIDDKLAKAMANTNVNTAELKALLDAKQKISSTISQLAEQSCLSLKHNKNASKGENTWTGKIKKLKELNLREAEVNGFDINTCRGMQQVLEMSDASIMKQLALDESEWSDIVADQRKKLIDVQNERDVYREINRILLRENLDLRDTLEDEGLLDTDNLQNLKELFSAFGDTEAQAEEDDDIE
jgi:hypothetical protein